MKKLMKCSRLKVQGSRLFLCGLAVGIVLSATIFLSCSKNDGGIDAFLAFRKDGYASFYSAMGRLPDAGNLDRTFYLPAMTVRIVGDSQQFDYAPFRGTEQGYPDLATRELWLVAKEYKSKLIFNEFVLGHIVWHQIKWHCDQALGKNAIADPDKLDQL